MDIALKFDSIDVATTMSRVLRRQVMVVKDREREREEGGGRRQMWMDVHFVKLLVSSAAYSHRIFFCSVSST